MADVNLPQLPQLGNMMQLNPLAFNMAQDQMGLANQFAKQNLDMGEQDLQTKTLNNLFQTQNDPLKIQKSQQDIEGQGYENILKKVDAEQRQTLAPEELEAKRAKLVKSWSDSKIESALNDAQMMVFEGTQKGDQAMVDKGKSLYANSFNEYKARLKQKDEMEKTHAEIAGRKDVAEGNNAATRYSADRMYSGRVDAANARRQDALSFEDKVAKYAHNYEALQGMYEMRANQLEQDGDTSGADFHRQQADRYRVLNENKITAGANIRNAGQIDLPATTNGGVKVIGNKQQPVPPVPTRGAPAGPRPAPQGGVGVRGAFTGTPEEVFAQIDASPVSPAVKAEMRSAYANQQAGTNPAYNDMGTGAQSVGTPQPPPKAPAAPTQKPITSVADLKAMSPAYGNIPDEKLRELYKKKTGVDLK